MAKLFLTLLLSLNLFAIQNLQPTTSFKATGTVQSMVYEDGLLYAGTDNGTVEIFELKTNKKVKTIKIPDIKDFMGDTIPAKIYAVDKLNNKILIASQGMKGYRNIFIYENEKLEKVIGIDKKYFFQRAAFVSKKQIVFGLLSNQIGLYDIVKKELLYLTQISPSSFSHFKVSEDKKTLATTDESGIVRVLDIQSGRVIEELEALNLDRVYQLDYKQGVILTAGQDRKAVVYNGLTPYKMEFNFLLYSCGLSPKAKLGAIAHNEQNEVLVFNINTQKKLFNLIGQKATLTQILFINENEVFVSSDDPNITYFKLQQ